MKLYLLKRIDLKGFYKHFGFVIAAWSPVQARRIAARHVDKQDVETWVRTAESKLTVLTLDGQDIKEGIILDSF